MCSLRSLKPHVRTQKEEARQRELGRAKELEAKILGKQKRADELKAISLKVVRDYYEKWGTVFEFYDALNTTDPTQTLRKPPYRDIGKCTPGVAGLAGHCGAGGIRDYNFCAGIALLWLRGGE